MTDDAYVEAAVQALRLQMSMLETSGANPGDKARSSYSRRLRFKIWRQPKQEFISKWLTKLDPAPTLLAIAAVTIVASAVIEHFVDNAIRGAFNMYGFRRAMAYPMGIDELAAESSNLRYQIGVALDTASWLVLICCIAFTLWACDAPLRNWQSRSFYTEKTGQWSSPWQKMCNFMLHACGLVGGFVCVATAAALALIWALADVIVALPIF